MKCCVAAVEIFFALTVLYTLVHTTSGQDDCPPLTLADLGSNVTSTTMGLISPALDGGPPVRIIDFNIVCLAQGTRRNTFSTASVLVQYSMDQPAETDLFFLTCRNGNWSSTGAFFSPTATLSTPTNTSCFRCGFGEVTPEMVTFCHGKFTIVC